jgi:MFS family permease
MAPAGLRHALSPFSVQTFRSIWAAAFCLNTGLFVQDLGAVWLMTSLSQTPLMVASLQTAAMLSYLLLSLPAGAGADMINRRKLLMFGQAWLIFVTVTMSVLTLTGHMSAWGLLLLAFLMAVGNAVNSPAWNVVMPSLVPRKLLEPTISITNAGFNMARGVGSIAGGLIVASFGSGWAFAVCGVASAVMFATLCRWRYDEQPAESPANFFDAVKTGLVYARQSKILNAVLVRTVLYVFPVSVMWSLMPLFAREHLHINSTQYGFIVAAFGMGTLIGAVLQPRIRQHLSLDGLSALGTVLFVVAFLTLSVASHFAVGMFAMLLCGMGWTSKNAALNISVQLSAPQWIRARAYSVYLVFFQGSIAVGSLVWGSIAGAGGIPSTFAIAASVLLVELAARQRCPLEITAMLQATPAD